MYCLKTCKRKYNLKNSILSSLQLGTTKSCIKCQPAFEIRTKVCTTQMVANYARKLKFFLNLCFRESNWYYTSSIIPHVVKYINYHLEDLRSSVLMILCRQFNVLRTPWFLSKKKFLLFFYAFFPLKWKKLVYN